MIDYGHRLDMVNGPTVIHPVVGAQQIEVRNHG